MHRHGSISSQSAGHCCTFRSTAPLLPRSQHQQPFSAATAACSSASRRRCNVMCSANSGQQSPEPTAGSSGAAKASSALATATDAAAVAGPTSNNDSAPPLQPGEHALRGRPPSYKCASWAVCAQLQMGALGASAGKQVGILTIVPDGGSSPLGPPWQEVMTHISDRLAWADPAFRMQVHPCFMCSRCACAAC